MRSLTLRSAFVAGIAAMVFFGATLECKACEWLWPWNWCRRPAPTYAAPACCPCPPQTCYYVPQTCYRTAYQYVPTTTCRPVSTCDPCTGCAVTTYRPFRSFALRPTLVPYRSLRIVYGQSYAPACSPCGSSCAPSSACGSCGVSGVSGVGSVPMGTGSSCPSCTAPAVSPSTVIPGPASTAPSLLPGPSASYGPSTSAPRTFVSPSTSAPGTGAPTNGAASPARPATGNSTYLMRPWAPNTYTGPSVRSSVNATPVTPKVDSSVKPIPEPSSTPASANPPQLTPPNNRTTTGLIRQAVYVTTPAAAQAQPAADPYDWHASRD